MGAGHPKLGVGLAQLLKIAGIVVGAIHRLRRQLCQQLNELRRCGPHLLAQIQGLRPKAQLQRLMALQIPFPQGRNGLVRGLLTQVLSHGFKRVKHVTLPIVLEVSPGKIQHERSEGRISAQIRHQLKNSQVEQVVVVELHLKLAGQAQFNGEGPHQTVGELVKGAQRNRAVVVKHFAQHCRGAAPKLFAVHIQKPGHLLGNGVL